MDSEKCIHMESHFSCGFGFILASPEFSLIEISLKPRDLPRITAELIYLLYYYSYFYYDLFLHVGWKQKSLGI